MFAVNCVVGVGVGGMENYLTNLKQRFNVESVDLCELVAIPYNPLKAIYIR